MSKTNTNRSRKAKATVRTNKPRSPEVVTKEINTRKVNKALCSPVFTEESLYSISIGFDLNNEQDMNDPILWLEDKMGEKVVDRLNTGSGTCLMTGLRDFGFTGSKSEMILILKNFARSPFRIEDIFSTMEGMD